MLNPSHKYISFDFETTGLDTKKDEPIQIGIVVFDHEFKIVDTFSSLIKPKKDIKQLKSIVAHLTGFALEDLEDAPSMEELLPTLHKYFTPEVIVVGQNISFDCAFLKRYMEYEPIYQVDTFTLTKALFHYLPSYALDVINEHLRKTNQHRESGEDDYHDALHDSYLAYNLFHQCMKRLTKLRREYLILDYMFQNSDGLYTSIIKRTPKPYAFENKELFFPSLQQKSISDNKKIIAKTPLSFEDYAQYETLDVSLLTLKEIISKTKWGTGKWILAFTHPSKVTIAQKLFKKQHIPTNSWHDSIVFDPARVNTFLHQKNFDDGELLFTLKYYSQFEQKHSILDINSQDDYKVFSALSNPEKQNRSWITLCTHSQLYGMNKEDLQEYTLLFFDKDRWSGTYSRHMKQQFDPTYLLNHLEQISYKYSLLNHEAAWAMEEFYNKTLFLHSTLCMEINPFFKGSSANKVEFVDIAQETRFPKTRQLIPIRKEQFESLKQWLMKEDQWVETKITEFYDHLTGQTTVSKRMHAGDKRYYQFQDSHTYVQRDDFKQDLPTPKSLFLSNKKRTQHDQRTQVSLKEDTVETLEFLKIKTQPKIPELIEMITTAGENCFVVSSDKSRSKMLFDALVKQWVSRDFEILWENITWWMGKNLYRGSISSKPVLLIGWYNFCLGAMAKEIHFPTAYLYHLHGKLAAQIVTDILRWWEKKKE